MLSTPRPRHHGLAIAAAAIMLLACREDDGGPRPGTVGGGDPAGEARRIRSIVGFHGPESVRYDPELDVYYVSNIYLYGSGKDDNGFISRVSAADLDQGTVLVQGGRNGVTLHAPKGLALHGDTLWVADIDVLRGFHRTTGAPLATVDFAPHRPTLLNDVAIAPDGTIRVTDSGIVMSSAGVVYDTIGDRIFRVGPGREITAQPVGKPYPKPNGITWDARGSRWLTVTFDPFRSTLYAIADGDSTRTPLAEGKGRWDGVEMLADGRIILSSWSDSSIHVVDGSGDRQIIRNVPQPADFAVDTKRNRIAIPLVQANRVEVWTVPPR